MLRKCLLGLCIISLIAPTSGCESGINKEASILDSTISHSTVLELDNIEYWDEVGVEIVTMLNEHGLYVSAINSSYPCVFYYVEPGKQSNDGQIVAAGLSKEEYEKLRQRIVEELHSILDNYRLAKPKTVFHACDSIVGIVFNNWFVDNSRITDSVISLEVANYEIDLLKYYYEHEEGSYVYVDGMSENIWLKYNVYEP